ncbi:hypothetical protein [Gloeocapsopsis sp. IPPAS B-1203]|uniref:hypothetical protein n=1 Tax=Gloeocapsopsis sp. IPPAS B-1203 TaxID=2049454 RepID=UPI0025A2AD08|nr:hypothetical protein [Gloeocapsopsis sp. IPPAS B-1203]
MRILIDTNVVLDFLQEREPFVENAAIFLSVLMLEMLRDLLQQRQSPTFIISSVEQQGE